MYEAKLLFFIIPFCALEPLGVLTQDDSEFRVTSSEPFDETRCRLDCLLWIPILLHIFLDISLLYLIFVTKFET